jgi:uncharacterized protein YggT (Ycf19 family)
MATRFFEPQSTFGRRHYMTVRLAQVIDYLFGILYSLLAIRLVLVLIGARRGAGFVEFIVTLTRPFYAPFQGIVASEPLDGHLIAWPIVVAIVAYMLLHGLIRGLLRLLDRA